MDTNTPEAPLASAAGSTKTVNSPEQAPKPKESARNASSKRPATERPTEPYNLLNYPRYTTLDSPIGNPKAIAAARMEGHLGLYYDRENTTKIPTLVSLNMDNFRESIRRTLTRVLTDLLRSQKQFDLQTQGIHINNVVNDICQGVCVATYMKLRIVNYHDRRVSDRYRMKAKVPIPFEVPQAYALAISQLGAVKISGEVEELYFTPTVPAGVDESYGCSDNYDWSPVEYSSSLEFAKKLGMQVSTVDLTVKMGSSWWLFRPSGERRDFKLLCPFNEENFTENTAVLAGLFCNNANGGFYNPIIDLDTLGNRQVGSMLRSLPRDFALNVYYAVVDEKTISYKIGD